MEPFCILHNLTTKINIECKKALFYLSKVKKKEKKSQFFKKLELEHFCTKVVRCYLKELQNYKQKIFLCLQKDSQHFKLLLASRIYLVFLPLEMQGRLKQPKVSHTLFYFVCKETTHKPLEVATAKHFAPVCVIGTTCFEECFLFYVTTGRYYFHNSLMLLNDCFNAMSLLSLKPLSGRKSLFYALSPR